jgi:hypothetical protein
LAPFPEDLGGSKVKRIFQLNSKKVVQTRKESNENRRVVVWRAEMGEEGLRKRSRPKNRKGFERSPEVGIDIQFGFFQGSLNSVLILFKTEFRLPI